MQWHELFGHENNHPAIVSAEMFDEVQEAKQERSRSHTAGGQSMSFYCP